MESPSLVIRIAIGKLVGLAFGLAAFFLLPVFDSEADWLIRWGILLWYPTVGGVIGMAGVFDKHPVLNVPLPWWFRGPMIGGWMNFVLTFFAYDVMAQFMQKMFAGDGILTSPMWFVLEGAIVGLVIGFLATHIGGEGKETVGR